MAGQFGLRLLPRKSLGSFTCRKSVTWDRRLYFPPKEGMLWIFSPEKSDGFGRFFFFLLPCFARVVYFVSLELFWY
jgi:hypothetical protein